MIDYRPAGLGTRLGQTPRTVAVPTQVVTPPPPIDPIFVGYTGITGFIEIAAVLTISSAGAWAGIRTGMSQGSKTIKIAGWVGGVGSALIGLLYLGGKSGLGSQVGLPAVRVTPS